MGVVGVGSRGGGGGLPHCRRSTGSGDSAIPRHFHALTTDTRNGMIVYLLVPTSVVEMKFGNYFRGI